MKQVSLSPFLSLLCVALFGLANQLKTFCQEPLAPLKKKELIDLCQEPTLKNYPERILNDIVQKNKIAFLPTREIVRFLQENGVPKIITDKLKYNFASTLVYRICTFKTLNGTDEEFTLLLNNALNNERLMTTAKSDSGLLRDKTFNPDPAGPGGPTKEELDEHPHLGYLLVGGSISDSANTKIVVSDLFYVSRIEEKMSIATIKRRIANTLLAKQDLARELARWSIQELERQIR